MNDGNKNNDNMVEYSNHDKDLNIEEVLEELKHAYKSISKLKDSPSHKRIAIEIEKQFRKNSEIYNVRGTDESFRSTSERVE